MVVHSKMEMLRQRIYQIMAGFEDVDDTNADTYGAQQLTLSNAYYREYCYMPLLLFEGRICLWEQNLSAVPSPQ